MTPLPAPTSAPRFATMAAFNVAEWVARAALNEMALVAARLMDPWACAVSLMDT